MKKFLFIILLYALSIPTLFAAQVMPQEITGDIEYSLIDDEVILTGHCTLTHDLTIIPPHGQLTITRGATLEIQPKKNCNEPLAYLKIFCFNRNSLVFDDQNSTMILNGAIAFNFYDKHEFHNGTFIVNPLSRIRMHIAEHDFWEKQIRLIFSKEFKFLIAKSAEFNAPEGFVWASRKKIKQE